MMTNMMNIKHIYFIAILLMPFNAMAEEKPKLDEFTLMKQAVEYSTKADVYNAHCKKESSLADSFIEKFEEKRGIKGSKKSILIALQDKQRKETLDKVKGVDCKDLEFMMKRLEIMRHLKDVSYILNGVDPSTIPEDNIPDLEGLLPPKSDIPDITRGL